MSDLIQSVANKAMIAGCTGSIGTHYLVEYFTPLIPLIGIAIALTGLLVSMASHGVGWWYKHKEDKRNCMLFEYELAKKQRDEKIALNYSERVIDLIKDEKDVD